MAAPAPHPQSSNTVTDINNDTNNNMSSAAAAPAQAHPPMKHWQSFRKRSPLTVGGFQQPRHHYNNQGFLPNGGPGQPVPGATPLLPNQGRVLDVGPTRVLCIADVRGKSTSPFDHALFTKIFTHSPSGRWCRNLRSLNDLAKQARANYIVHTGDFGFYDDTSLERIAEKTLKHVAQYSPLISEPIKKSIQQGSGPVKQRFPASELPLSELSLLISGEVKLDVPVYTVWGACEDVRVLERFRAGEYKIPNLMIIDEARSALIDVGGVKLRLLGLGGAVVMHKLFDNGEGRTTIAGGQGTMWTTLLQMGELVDTANRVYDPTETRVFVTHASPAREGILNQLSVTLKADFSISAGLHFRYGSSYNEFSVNPTLDHYRGKLAASKASFNDVWETVKSEVEPAIQQNEAQQKLLKNALSIVEKMPTTAAGGNPFGGPVAGGALGQVDESAFKNMWNFNLADAAFGWLVLEVQDGRIGTEMRAQGFNFSHRGAKQPPVPAGSSAVPAGPASSTGAGQSPASIPVRPASTAQQVKSGTPLSNPSKPATPQPNPAAASPAPAKEPEKAPTNGTNGPESVSSPAPRPPAESIVGLFIMNVQSEQQARDLFAPEDRASISSIEKWGQVNKVAVFKTVEERDTAYGNLPEDLRSRPQEDRSKPLVKIFQVRESKIFSQGRGAGSWQSGRGGGGAGAAPSGYRSAGGASDSERDRRGGRGGGRGGRGGDRGRGGRGRGGGMDKASPAPMNATPAAE
ncbi:hypothetical protein MKZ38_004223 [Zalerion maritima]|uniref:DUF2433 domain-containing protein n=1 Tax=Zalerion maritima TaxID=339359 RepID=A0AAD5RLW3_9PEZI|nr:hypothetical protein MKZ38_004223 [Zalerion maritima]